MHFEPISSILLEDGDDHTNDVVDDGDDAAADDDDDDDGDDGDGDDDNDDNDPVELFQKQGKWWELIAVLLFGGCLEIRFLAATLCILPCPGLFTNSTQATPWRKPSGWLLEGT